MNEGQIRTVIFSYMDTVLSLNGVELYVAHHDEHACSNCNLPVYELLCSTY